MTRITLDLRNPVQAKPLIDDLWHWVKAQTTAKKRVQIVAKTESRSLAQNQIMWSCLTDLSKQVEWFGKRMTPDAWKCWITGHLNGQELHPNMDGSGFISVTKGTSTSDMTIAEMVAVVDLCHAFGADRGVKWSVTSLGRNGVDPETGEVLQ